MEIMPNVREEFVNDTKIIKNDKEMCAVINHILYVSHAK